MSEEDAETIHVADVSEGVGGDAESDPGEPIELPVVDVLTGRSFITGKSGSGKSNTASVLIENLLEDNYPVLIVDTDGEYYGLKEEYEILHVGADDECDIVVSPEHAEKIATLALDQNVPIILDVSGYLEDSVASELILNVVQHLFAKEKKLKRPFLLVIEECHEYIPEGGGMDETGKMLIKVGKRGRKHGLGIVGISQRPADVKKDFITQCDWLVWHRLTWDNDTNVVSRILGSEYADAIEDMGDGEAFLMTDWEESIRRIQFHRKQTFDAGATPGLEDFERPELKSVSGDLVSELETISDEQERRESELADLRQELETKRARITQLEQELEDAKDLSRMADRFSQALLRRSDASYRGGTGETQAHATRSADEDARDDQSALNDYERAEDPEQRTSAAAQTAADRETADREVADTETTDSETANSETTDSETANSETTNSETTNSEIADAAGTAETVDDRAAGDSETTAESIEWIEEPETVTQPGSLADAIDDVADAAAEDDDPAGVTDLEPITAADVAESALRFDEAIDLGTREAVVENLRDRVEALPEMSTEMLRHYRREGTSDPVAAHIAAGGDGDTEHAYARHRPLRRAGLVRHNGQSRYAYGIPWLVREAYADRLDEDTVTEMVNAVEDVFVSPPEQHSEVAAASSQADATSDPDTIDATQLDAALGDEVAADEPGTTPDADDTDIEEADTPIATPGLSEAAKSMGAESDSATRPETETDTRAEGETETGAEAETDTGAEADQTTEKSGENGESDDRDAAGAGLDEDAEVLSKPDDTGDTSADSTSTTDEEFDPAADDAEIVDPNE